MREGGGAGGNKRNAIAGSLTHSTVGGIVVIEHLKLFAQFGQLALERVGDALEVVDVLAQRKLAPVELHHGLAVLARLVRRSRVVAALPRHVQLPGQRAQVLLLLLALLGPVVAQRAPAVRDSRRHCHVSVYAEVLLHRCQQDVELFVKEHHFLLLGVDRAYVVAVVMVAEVVVVVVL